MTEEQLREENARLREENVKLASVVAQQGAFIESMREMIADFVYGKERASLGRLHGRR
jgi:hypothetical protein